jgi:hypothetical protein
MSVAKQTDLSPEDYPIGHALLLFAEEMHLDGTEANLYARELKRYLVLASETSARFPMHERLDRLWHAWMLDTKSYQGFMSLLGGPFVHHVAADDGSEHATWSQFGEAYLERFGVRPDDRVWPAGVLGDDRTAWVKRLERIAAGEATRACWTIGCGTSTTDSGGDFTTCTT